MDAPHGRPRYDPESIRALFDGMAATYGVINLLTSFGFAAHWRRQAVEALPRIEQFVKVADLMSGMGELWWSMARLVHRPSEVVAVDLSAEMARRASAQRPFAVALHVADVLAIDFEPGSFDAIVSSFGLKTFNSEQQGQLATLVALWLRPGGAFSFVEISVPPGRGAPCHLYVLPQADHPISGATAPRRPGLLSDARGLHGSVYRLPPVRQGSRVGRARGRVHRPLLRLRLSRSRTKALISTSQSAVFLHQVRRFGPDAIPGLGRYSLCGAGCSSSDAVTYPGYGMACITTRSVLGTTTEHAAR